MWHIRFGFDRICILTLILIFVILLRNEVAASEEEEEHDDSHENLANITQSPFRLFRRIEKPHKSVIVMEGDALEIFCNISGLRPNETLGQIKIRFYKDGEELPDYWRLKYSRSLLRRDDVIVRSEHSFAYRSANQSHRGEYKCEARDKSVSYLVRVKDPLRPLWPFLIICAEISVLAAILGLYELRQKRIARMNSFRDR